MGGKRIFDVELGARTRYMKFKGAPMTKADQRFSIVLERKSSREPPAKKPMPVEQETANPLPAKYHTGEHHPFTDDEENDPETEDDQ